MVPNRKSEKSRSNESLVVVLATGQVLNWLEYNGTEWAKLDERESILNSLEEHVSEWIIPLTERAETLAQIASIASTWGFTETAEHLILRACDNLFGYGYHKDTFLYGVLSTLDVASQAEYPYLEQNLCELGLMIRHITDITDGDETRHLPIELYERICKHTPARAGAYLLDLLTRQRYDLFEECHVIYLRHQAAHNAVALALAETVTSNEELLAANELKMRNIEWLHEHAADKALMSQSNFERWSAIDLPLELRVKPGTDEQQSAVSDSLQDKKHSLLAEVNSPSELLEWLRNNQMGIDESVSDVIDLLRKFYDRPIPEELASLQNIARWWLSQRRIWKASEVLDCLWELLLRHGYRSLAFDCLVKAQDLDHGWGSYFTSDLGSKSCNELAPAYY